MTITVLTPPLEPLLVLHFTPKPNIYGSMAARTLRIPYVNNIAGLGTAFAKKGFLSLVVKNLYRHSQISAYRLFVQTKRSKGSGPRDGKNDKHEPGSKTKDGAKRPGKDGKRI